MKHLFLLGGLLFTIQLMAQSSVPYQWKNVEIVGGGFVPGIIYNETEQGLLYARTDIGGAYKMNNNTNRWECITDWIGWDNWGWTGIVSLATDPVEPNRLYLAAGTYTNDWDSINGAILISSDYGNNFSISQLPFKLGGNMPGRGMGERLAIDPNNNSILYLGAPCENGLWKSTDYAASWSQVSNFPSVGNYAEDPNDPNGYLSDLQGIVWVTFDKSSGTSGNTTPVIYVGVADTITSVYRTTDGGSTWEAVPGQPSGFIPHKGKLDEVNGYLYVAYSDNGGPYGGEKGDVWRYNTSTGEWLLISPYPATSDDCFFGYSGVAIDKQNPNTVMVTGYSSWWPDAQIWRSNDNGITWTRIWDWTRYPNRSFLYTQDITDAPWLYWGGPPGGGRPGAEVFPKLGWMVEELAIDPFNSNNMMYGTGATIYGCNDLTVWDQGGQITLKVMAMGLEETAIQELISPPAGPPLLSGMYDIYGFTHQQLDVVEDAFHESPMIATLSMDYAESNPSYIFRVGEGDEDNKSAGFSTDGGTTWAPVLKEPTGVVTGKGTCAVNSAGTIVVWSPDDAAVNYSVNNGGAWVACSGIPANAIVESDRVNPNKFYGFKDGTFYISTDGGATFSASPFSGLPDAAFFRAATSNEGHVWLAGYDTGMWLSTDGGQSFTNLSNVEEADNVGFGMAAPGETYPAIYTCAKVSGTRGVFRSIDQGASWVRINDDQHQYGWIGKTITGDPRVYGRVYLATNGRGIIYGDIDESGPTNNDPVAIGTANPTSGDVPLLVNFDASASYDPDEDPLTFDWNFGDSNTGSGAIVSHTYQSDGVFTAVVTVSDGNGGVDTKPFTITVTTPGNDNPVAIASANPTSGDAPLLVNFDGSASYDPDSDPLTYDWDFGDGSSSQDVAPSNTYAAPGSYAAKLVVDDGQGGADSTTIEITVTDGSVVTGSILAEYWLGVAGGAVSDLTSHPDYPDNPTGSEQFTSFDAPINVTDSYGRRIRGYVHPPTSGDYTFWIAADETCELWMSTDDNPANASLVAYLTKKVGKDAWNTKPEQQSPTVSLVAGQKYYIEALHKDPNGPDHISVAWEGPGITQQIIAGGYLSPFDPMKSSPVLFTGLEAGELTVYPNPFAAGELTVFYNGASLNNAQISINELSGRLIYQNANLGNDESGNQLKIQLPENISKGVYIVTLRSDGKMQNVKLIVK